MTKKYKLLKDLPGLCVGEIIPANGQVLMNCSEENFDDWSDWFELIEEKSDVEFLEIWIFNNIPGRNRIPDAQLSANEKRFAQRLLDDNLINLDVLRNGKPLVSGR